MSENREEILANFQVRKTAFIYFLHVISSLKISRQVRGMTDRYSHGTGCGKSNFKNVLGLHRYR